MCRFPNYIYMVKLNSIEWKTRMDRGTLREEAGINGKTEI